VGFLEFAGLLVRNPSSYSSIFMGGMMGLAATPSVVLWAKAKCDMSR
jgi:hypothetical protein